MSKYDFNKLLEPYEFQYLVRDILQIREKTFFESFSQGPDGGIDLRKKINDNSVIVQVKRYKNDFPKFLNSLKTYELPKLQRLKPDRYIIATSVTLTVSQKDKVLDLFKDYIKSPEDIISESDFNNLLEQEEYYGVELKYPNLWFNSSNTFFEKMNYLINNDLYEETRAEYNNIKDMMKYYVQTPNFSQIIKNIKINKYILITGNPGVGKTSLARALTAYFIQKEEYEFIYARNIESVNKVYNQNKKQLFFIDDFWGSSFKEKDYNYDSERRLIEFIKKVNKSSNKILILTSRDYVLKQGLMLNIDLDDILTQNIYLLELKNYNSKIRAEILMRHLNKSKLKYRYIEFIARNAEGIVNHQNFNPRIIESYINSGFDLEEDVYNYYKYFITSLDEPFGFLNKIYKKQTKEARLLLYLILTINRPILLENLQELYLNALDKLGIKDINNCNIESAISQLEKNFIKTKYIEKHGIIVNFINPSIKDYLYEFKENFLEFSNTIIDSLTYFNQVEFFLEKKEPYYSFKLTKEQEEKIEKILIERFEDLRIIRGEFFETIEFEKLTNEQQILYKITRLIRINNLSSRIIALLISYIEKIIEQLKKNNRTYINEEELSRVIDIIKFLNKYKKINPKEMFDIYYKNCEHTYELFFINKFEDIFPKDYQEFINNNKKEYEELLKEMIYIDLEVYSYAKNYRSLSELLNLLDEDLFYLWENDEALKDEIEYFSFIPDSYYEEQDKLFYLDEEEVEDDVEDISKYCLKILEIEEKNYEENLLEKQASGILSYKEVLFLRKIIEDIDYSFLINFIFEKEQVDLLIRFYKKYQYIPNKINIFCYLLLDFILEENNLDKNIYFEKVIDIATATFYKNEKVFSLETLSNDIEFNINDSEYQNILNSSLFIKNGKWISFVNPLIQIFSICCMIKSCDSELKEKIYDEIIFACSPMNVIDFDFIDDLKYFHEILQEIDAEGFKYYLDYYIGILLENINQDNDKSIICSIIKYFMPTIYLDNLNYKSLESCSFSAINLLTSDLLELLTEEYYILTDLINKKAFNEFKVRFKDFIIRDHNETGAYKIELSELLEDEKFYIWLQKYNIDKKIIRIYYVVKFINDFLKENYAKSFKEYKEIIKSNLEKNKELV